MNSKYLSYNFKGINSKSLLEIKIKKNTKTNSLVFYKNLGVRSGSFWASVRFVKQIIENKNVAHLRSICDTTKDANCASRTFSIQDNSFIKEHAVSKPVSNNKLHKVYDVDNENIDDLKILKNIIPHLKIRIIKNLEEILNIEKEIKKINLLLSDKVLLNQNFEQYKKISSEYNNITYEEFVNKLKIDLLELNQNFSIKNNELINKEHYLSTIERHFEKTENVVEISNGSYFNENKRLLADAANVFRSRLGCLKDSSIIIECYGENFDFSKLLLSENVSESEKFFLSRVFEQGHYTVLSPEDSSLLGTGLSKKTFIFSGNSQSVENLIHNIRLSSLAIASDVNGVNIAGHYGVMASLKNLEKRASPKVVDDVMFGAKNLKEGEHNPIVVENINHVFKELGIFRGAGIDICNSPGEYGKSDPEVDKYFNTSITNMYVSTPTSVVVVPDADYHDLKTRSALNINEMTLDELKSKVNEVADINAPDCGMRIILNKNIGLDNGYANYNDKNRDFKYFEVDEYINTYVPLTLGRTINKSVKQILKNDFKQVARENNVDKVSPRVHIDTTGNQPLSSAVFAGNEYAIKQAFKDMNVVEKIVVDNGGHSTQVRIANPHDPNGEPISFFINTKNNNTDSFKLPPEFFSKQPIIKNGNKSGSDIPFTDNSGK